VAGCEAGAVRYDRQNACQQYCTNKPHKLPVSTSNRHPGYLPMPTIQIAEGTPRGAPQCAFRPRLRHHFLAL
jgi:hypothetical protein